MSKKIFTVYSKDACPYCTKVIGALQLAELSFVEYKLGRDFTRGEFFDEFGEGTTFPQVLCNDKSLGGCKETVIYLKENNLV